MKSAFMTVSHETEVVEPQGRGVIFAGDARQAERALFDALEPLLAAALSDPVQLARPIRIVVPSQTLREQLSSHLAAHFDGAALGVEIQTIRALSSEVAARTGVRIPEGEDAFGILVERRARNETALSSKLADLEGAGPAVAGTVRDLFDALFQEEQLGALQELIELELFGEEARVATAICRVAALVRRDLEEADSVSLDQHYGEVAEAIRKDPNGAIPHRGVFIHGFADATEAVTALLGSLRDHADATLILELPRDPTAPSNDDDSSEYAASFGERLGLAQLDRDARAGVTIISKESTELGLRAASDQDSEVRAVCEAVLSSVEAGIPFEQIGILTRSLEVRKRALRRQLEALGIPYGTAANARGSVGRPDRRARALAALLKSKGDCPLDHFFALRCREDEVDMILALRSLGAGRLCDLPALDFGDRLSSDGTLALPSRRGFSAPEPAGGEEFEDDDSSFGAADSNAFAEEPEEEFESGRQNITAPRAERRRIATDSLRAVIAEVQSLLETLEAWPDQLSFGEWRDLISSCTVRFFSDPDGDPDGELDSPQDQDSSPPAIVRRVLADMDLRDEFSLQRDEFIRVFSLRCESTSFDPFGSTGGGVRVLDVTQARGLTFADVHLLAVERDVFPRTPAEDPLLRDAARRKLRELLPGLPLKRASSLEERYLFAQACGSADRVTVSYARTSDARGNARSPSPFFQRLERTPEERIARTEVAPLLSGQCATNTVHLRPELEWAVLHGLLGDPEAALKALPSVQAVALNLSDAALASNASGGREQALAALNPSRDAQSLGPFLGRIGSPSQDDPRAANQFFVTHFESVARCSWQAFLEKTLRVERVPDPLEALPMLEAWMVGKTLHGALEALAKEALSNLAPEASSSPQDLGTALDGRKGAPWSAPATEEKRIALLRQVASQVLREEGITWEGLALPLAQRALPFLDEVCRLELDPIGSQVLATEIEGEMSLRVPVRGELRDYRLLFRADEVRLDDTGSIVLIDWKTSHPINNGKGALTREKHHKFAVSSGKALQTIAYVRAARELGAERASGAYVYLKPEAPDYARIFPASTEAASWPEFDRAFDDVVSTVATALRSGGMPPRLFDHGKQNQEGAACKWCRVSEACLRGDSGARARLASFVEATPVPESSMTGGVHPNGDMPSDVAIARRVLDLTRKGRLDEPEEAAKSTGKAKS